MATPPNNRGIPPLPTGLMRPTTPPAAADAGSADGPARAGGSFTSASEALEAAKRAGGFAPSVPDLDSVGPAEADPAPTGPATSGKARRTRKPSAPVEKTNKRGLYLGDDVWDRLSLEAHHKRTTASAVAQAILDKHLPRFTLNREG